jgi:hypothetical protein
MGEKCAQTSGVAPKDLQYQLGQANLPPASESQLAKLLFLKRRARQRTQRRTVMASSSVLNEPTELRNTAAVVSGGPI